MKIAIDLELCKGCGFCIEACPNNAIYTHRGKAFIDQTKCSFCQLCTKFCPTGAIQLFETEDPVIITKPDEVEVIPFQSPVEPSRGDAGWGALLLSLAGQYVLPRMMDVLAIWLEQRVFPKIPEQTALFTDPKNRYLHKRHRQRRGRMVS